MAIGLADAIEALRGEIMAAAVSGEDQAMRFSIEPVELTIQVAITKEGNGKIGWHVLEAGVMYESVTTQTLTLKLTPLWLQEDGTLTADFVISAPSLPSDVLGPRD